MTEKLSYQHQVGPELDKAVAEKMGVVPCDGWASGGVDTVIGPHVIGTTCPHATGACYPTVEVAGDTIGGPPKFSQEGHPRELRLRDLPPKTTLQLDPDDPDGPWHVRRPRGETNTWHGESEAHALCRAFLDIGEPKWNDGNRWHPVWRETAELLGLDPEDLPEPWTPLALVCVGRLIEAVRIEGWQGAAEGSSRRKKRRVVHNPTQGRSIQGWLWKLTEAGVGDGVMGQVNELLKAVMEAPGVPGEPCPWTLKDGEPCRR